MTKHLPSPCPACPFRKDIKPGALGGSAPEVYIGQAYGPFLLPCHQACDFTDPEWKAKVINTPQCAGAAIFRTHVDVDKQMPPGIHKLPANPAVFDSAIEFMSHHKGIGPFEALRQLQASPPAILAIRQLGRSTNTYHHTKEVT